MFYGDLDRRQRAVEVLRNMRKEGKHPLSKVPHLGDPELDNYVPQSSAAVTITPFTVGSDNGFGVCVNDEAVAEAVAVAVTVTEARPVSMDEDIVTEVQSACSSSSTPQQAFTSALDNKSSIGVLATIINKEVDIGLEMATHATEKEPILLQKGIEGEVGQRAEEKVEIEVEVEVEAGGMKMTPEEGIPPVEVQGGSETDKEYLVRTCRYLTS